ncbi:MAG: sulfotransferase domain-containing protein [Pirellulales bacterium]
MMSQLQLALSSRNGFVRKAAVAALQLPRWWRRRRARDEDFHLAPPVFANSFPKSGTHLLFQIVDGLPNTTNYGAFLASMTSSFQFRERTAGNASRFIRGFVPGEIVRGHLFFDSQNAEDLARMNVVHLFVYRDPRAVVLSEAHYLREMNRWHRLAPHFRKVATLDEAIMLSITGFDPPIAGLDYPNIAARFARYQGWLERDDCLAIRFEDLAGEGRDAAIRRVAEFFASHCAKPLDVAATVAAMSARIAPEKSHTFRSGKQSGWQNEFTAEHRRRFDELAGNLLIDLGYETNHDWASEQGAGSTERGVRI